MGDPKLLSPLVLAYIGDSVYDLFVREKLISEHNVNAGVLHKMAVKQVNAAAQAESFERIKGFLTEEEMAIYKRGRNAKSSVPKNADVVKYRMATGFEAVVGWLYLSGEQDRLKEIMANIFGSSNNA